MALRGSVDAGLGALSGVRSFCQTSDVATDDDRKGFGLYGSGGLSHRLCADLFIQKRPVHFFYF